MYCSFFYLVWIHTAVLFGTYTRHAHAHKDMMDWRVEREKWCIRVTCLKRTTATFLKSSHHLHLLLLIGLGRGQTVLGWNDEKEGEEGGDEFRSSTVAQDPKSWQGRSKSDVGLGHESGFNFKGLQFKSGPYCIMALVLWELHNGTGRSRLI